MKFIYLRNLLWFLDAFAFWKLYLVDRNWKLLNLWSTIIEDHQVSVLYWRFLTIYFCLNMSLSVHEFFLSSYRLKCCSSNCEQYICNSLSFHIPIFIIAFLRTFCWSHHYSDYIYTLMLDEMARSCEGSKLFIIYHISHTLMN